MTPPNVLVCYPAPLLRAQGEATLRVTAELRALLADEDVPESLLRDLDAMEAVGRWLAAATAIDLTKPIGRGIPSGGHLATGFPVTGPLPWTCS